MLHTEKEAAKSLGLSPVTLKRERRRGQIEYTLLGVRGIRYTQAQLDEYLERGRRRNATATPATVATAAPKRTSAVARVRSVAATLAQARAILNRK